MTSTLRWLLVALAAAGVALIVIYMRSDGNSPAGSPATPSNPAGRAAGAAPGEVDETDVKLELLQADRDSLTDAARNPFRFEAKPAPAPVRPTRPADDPPEIFTPPPVPSGPPPPPPIPLRYIGYVGSAGGSLTASFSDGRGNVIPAKEGDIIEGRYKVLRIGADSVELAYVDGRGRQTIRLSGQ